MARTQANGMKGDKRYKDAPRFQLIYGYEDAFKNSYNKHLKMMTVEIAKAMTDATKQSPSTTIQKAIEENLLQFETRNIGGDIIHYCRPKGESVWKIINERQYRQLGGYDEDCSCCSKK